MRIIYLGSFRKSYRTEVWITESLRQLGHEVFVIEEKNISIDNIKKKIDELEPDVFLFSKAKIKGDFNTILNYLRKKKIYSVCWLFDLFMGTPRAWQAKYSPMFGGDLTITTDGGHPKEFEAYGVDNHILRQGIFQDEAHFGKKIKAPEIVFVGDNISWWNYRDKLVSFLEKTYGNKFKRYGTEEKIRGEPLNNLLTSAKITIGDGVFSNNYWSNRIYETLGRGGFLISPKVVGLEKEFEYYKHFVPYDIYDLPQLKEIIDYYLTHDKEREVIRKAGHEYCKENYTYLIRCKKLIQIINENRNNPRSNKKRKIRNERDEIKRALLNKKNDFGGIKKTGTTNRNGTGTTKSEAGLHKLPDREKKGVTAILLNYKRPENYKRLIKSLRDQEEIDLDIWVWDSGNLPPIEGVKIFKDPINPGLFIRWELARFAKTKYILFIDDDVLPLDNRVLIDTVLTQEKYTPDTVVGWKGVKIKGGHNESQHVHSKHVKEDFGVHFCKGNYMLFNKENIADLKYMSPELLKIDSIAHGEFWYQLQMGKCKPTHKVIKCLEGRLSNKQTRGIGLEYRKDHYTKQAKHLAKCLEILS